MNKLLIISLASLMLVGCGSSDKETAEDPPAPDMTADGGGAAEDPAPAAEPEEEALTLSCSKNPATDSIGIGSNAIAVFTLSKDLNASADIQASCGAVLLENKSTSLITGKRDFSLNVPILCSGSVLKIEMTTNSTSASCTWDVL